ncbi:hypothetical protein [Solidesulfovibrio sp.]|uniref:hypothetical protein n=1 Tax=Solidesulfovibrio sp. TaxID=2910990 RepID=UPI00262AFE52|nr:hypothetical protein [Solidesulfovibrio sp.]
MTYPPDRGVIIYEELRPSLDVFAVTWVGDSLLSRAIRRFAPGGSHSSLGIKICDSIFLVEALEWGVDIKRASDRFDDYDGTILIHPIECSEALGLRIKVTALRMVAQRKSFRYGYLSLVRRIWGKFRVTMGRPICSQTVAYILGKHGMLPPQDMVLSPGELRELLPAPWRLAPYSKEAD